MARVFRLRACVIFFVWSSRNLCVFDVTSVLSLVITEVDSLSFRLCWMSSLCGKCDHFVLRRTMCSLSWMLCCLSVECRFLTRSICLDSAVGCCLLVFGMWWCYLLLCFEGFCVCCSLCFRFYLQLHSRRSCVRPCLIFCLLHVIEAHPSFWRVHLRRQSTMLSPHVLLPFVVLCSVRTIGNLVCLHSPDGGPFSHGAPKLAVATFTHGSVSYTGCAVLLVRRVPWTCLILHLCVISVFVMVFGFWDRPH